MNEMAIDERDSGKGGLRGIEIWKSVRGTRIPSRCKKNFDPLSVHLSLNKVKSN